MGESYPIGPSLADRQQYREGYFMYETGDRVRFLDWDGTVMKEAGENVQVRWDDGLVSWVQGDQLERVI